MFGIDFSKFFDKKGKGVKVVAESTPKDPAYKQVAAAHALRKGMWVLDANNRIGILMDANLEGIATVMLVQEDGTNLMQIHTYISSLRQARQADIPKPRRPSKDRAEQFGYK